MKSKRNILILATVSIATVAISFIVYSLALNRKIEKVAMDSKLEETELKLYLPGDEDSLKLIRSPVKKRSSPHEMANLIVEKLKENSVIPEETRLLHFAKGENGTLYIDFSRHVLEEMDDFFEVMRVYSIVNTFLSNFERAESVQLLIEGEALETFSGLLYTYFPLEFNEDLLEE